MARPKKEEAVDKKEVKEVKKSETSAKQQSLDLAIAQIEKQFGKGSIMTIRGYQNDEPIQHLSTGSLALDIVLGRGGLTFGRVVELYGAEGAGKTTLTLSILANAQKLGLRCAFIDKENALDPDYAERMGVNLEETYLSQPSTGEEALSIVEGLMGSGAIDVIVIDSVAALNPSADLEKTLADNAKMAGRASLLTRFFERNDSVIQKNKVLLICINQMRDGLDPYGPKKVTTGGKALKHATSYRIELHPVDKIKDSNGEIIGNQVRAKIVKNKLSSPFKETTYDLIFGKGIDKVKDLVDLAVQFGIIEKTGSWMTYGTDKFQGIQGAREFLNTEEKFEKLKKEVKDIAMPGVGKEGKNA